MLCSDFSLSRSQRSSKSNQLQKQCLLNLRRSGAVGDVQDLSAEPGQSSDETCFPAVKPGICENTEVAVVRNLMRGSCLRVGDMSSDSSLSRSQRSSKSKQWQKQSLVILRRSRAVGDVQDLSAEPSQSADETSFPAVKPGICENAKVAVVSNLIRRSCLSVGDILCSDSSLSRSQRSSKSKQWPKQCQLKLRRSGAVGD